MTCKECGSTVGHCPECGKEFEHGTADHCDNPSCVAVNAPIDCDCGFVVAAGSKGVLDYNMRLIPWLEERS
jgi:hypothetical protein